MSKRLQVVVDDSELMRFQRAARTVGLTTSEWARQTLRRAAGQIAAGDPDAKLVAIRAAARHDFPTADIDEMLAETERGYLSDHAL